MDKAATVDIHRKNLREAGSVLSDYPQRETFSFQSRWGQGMTERSRKEHQIQMTSGSTDYRDAKVIGIFRKCYYF